MREGLMVWKRKFDRTEISNFLHRTGRSVGSDFYAQNAIFHLSSIFCELITNAFSSSAPVSSLFMKMMAFFSVGFLLFLFCSELGLSFIKRNHFECFLVQCVPGGRRKMLSSAPPTSHPNNFNCNPQACRDGDGWRYYLFWNSKYTRRRSAGVFYKHFG